MKPTKLNFRILIILTILAVFCSCNNHNKDYVSIEDLREVYAQTDVSKWPKPHLDSLIDINTFEDIGLLPDVNFPEDNPYSFEKEELGKLLFFDGRLSESGQIACASCHNPELAFTDNITRSIGFMRNQTKRNSMTIKNVAFAKTLFWDGRAPSLEAQASMPIMDPKEMNTHVSVAVSNIQNIKGYKPYFKKAFGDTTITSDRIFKAIATYERRQISYNSKFDRFIKGKKELFTDQEVLGLHLFRTKARCINCHNTPYFSDNKFHNDGQTLFGTRDEDFGLYNHTKNLDDVGKFKTPTLREVGLTGPWMHHGNFPSLLDVIEFYNLGNPQVVQKKYLNKGRDSLLPKTSPLLKKLHLSEAEINSVIAFLKTLSTKPRRVNLRKLPKE